MNRPDDRAWDFFRAFTWAVCTMAGFASFLYFAWLHALTPATAHFWAAALFAFVTLLLALGGSKRKR